MSIVTEIVDAYPSDDQVLRLERNEQLLFAKPGPPVSNFLQKYPLLDVIHFPTKYTPSEFAPPRNVYSSEHIRVEWQKMSQRQPFYHRNADVDEISFHLTGSRTLLTERGSVDLKAGDFARIPVYTAHDNRGLDDVHLIFYLTTPAPEQVTPSRKTEMKMPPFDGWQPRQVAEVVTECLGTPGCDRMNSLVDEEMILKTASTGTLEPINIVNVYDLNDSSTETIWIYKSAMVWLGSTTLPGGKERFYYRHRRADEIQCQVKGTRILITQRGTIELEPGDFVTIPLGTAFTSVVNSESTHLSVLSRLPVEPKASIAKTAKETTREMVQTLSSR